MLYLFIYIKVWIWIITYFSIVYSAFLITIGGSNAAEDSNGDNNTNSPSVNKVNDGAIFFPDWQGSFAAQNVRFNVRPQTPFNPNPNTLQAYGAHDLPQNYDEIVNFSWNLFQVIINKYYMLT